MAYAAAWRFVLFPMLWAVGATSVAAARPAASAPCLAPADVGRTLARPAATGAWGPFRRVVAVTTRPAEPDNAAFDVRVKLPTGRCLALAGPDDPNQLFLFDVSAVRFAPVAPRRGNALVVFYTSSQIGPGRGSDRMALVYRVVSASGGQVRTDRRLLANVATLAQVQRQMGRR